MKRARSSGRVRAAVFLALAAALVVSLLASRARAADDAVVISVPPPTAPPPASPKLDPPPANVAAYAGRPISKVEVLVDDDTWPLAAVPRITSVRAGQKMSGQAARRAIDEALESGRFARARVDATPDGSGVRMVVHLVQRRLVDALRLDLHGAPIDQDELLREADLAEGGEVLGTEIPAYRERMLHYLARRGFPTAGITIETRETDDPGRVVVLVSVSPGGARVLERRAFYVFGAEPRALSPVLEGYRVPVGARCDEIAFDAADVTMTARLRALGYQRAEVSHDLVLAGSLITLRVRVEAGPRFEARFEGNEHYDAVALSGALALDEESDLAPGHLVQKLRDFYVKRGFLDVEISLETRGDEHATVHLLVFHVLEHPRVRVAMRAYPCVKVDEIKGLSGGGPRSPKEIGEEIDSFLDEELPGADLLRDPDPRGLDDTITRPAHSVRQGTRATPLDLEPDATYAPDTYDRAVLHVQELYRNEGYLHAEVGPVHVLRRRCDPRSPAGRCVPVAIPASPPDECTYDATNLPLPVAPLDPAYSCVPDPARGIECEPNVTLRIPIKLGPRTELYDLQFAGVHALTEKRAAAATELALGQPANVLKLEDARRKLVELYKEEGYAYADVKYTLDSSPDHTRARARFDVVEGDQVIVRQIVIRGNAITNDWVIRHRIALEVGKPYRTSDVRKTQERIATLNVFSNIGVALEEPAIPQREKVAIVTVVERKAQAIEPLVGVNTGEGAHGEFAYTYGNVGGDAIAFTFRARLAYLPDFLIFDQTVKSNFDCYGEHGPVVSTPPCSDTFSGNRLGYRFTATVALPEVGLGPLVRAQVDGVAVNDLERDFVLQKQAAIPTIYYTPFRELQFAISQSFELNKAWIFGGLSIQSYLQGLAAANQSSSELNALLRFPDGQSHAFAQRFVVTWDRRDDRFNPHRGTFFVSGFEHTDWFSDAASCPNPPCPVGGHTLRFSETFATYIPVTRSITLAGELRTGMDVQLTQNSNLYSTYPDRLFFLGGGQSVRGYQPDNMIPQEYADRIAADFGKAQGDPTKFVITDVGLRGGDFMFNPKVELRFPVLPPLSSVLFVDAGNVWLDPSYILKHGLSLRTAVGTGVRFDSPVGPVAFDVGLNLSRLVAGPHSPRWSYEDFGAFHFAIGLF